MLKQGIKMFLVTSLLINSCKNENNVQTDELKNVSYRRISLEEYTKIYTKADDSLTLWKQNHLSNYNFIKGKFDCLLDSQLCFNHNNDRLVTCLLEQVLVKESDNDGLIYFYGEKINNNWFFFRGPSIVILRSMIKGHDVHSPLSYQQLHQIALKQVYSGYLNRNGEINENWFKSHFEGNGWVNWDDTPEKIKSYTRKDYEQFHLRKVRSNWYGISKDSIKPLPQKRLP